MNSQVTLSESEGSILSQVLLHFKSKQSYGLILLSVSPNFVRIKKSLLWESEPQLGMVRRVGQFMAGKGTHERPGHRGARNEPQPH